MAKITKLIAVFDNGEVGDKLVNIQRDDRGNLYLETNGDSGRLTGFEWAGWGEKSTRDAISDCVREYGEVIGLNVASQCGGYEAMTEDERRIVDNWNEWFDR